MSKKKLEVSAPPSNDEMQDDSVDMLEDADERTGDRGLQPEERPKRTVWIFINRNPFPVHIPDPNDPGTRVTFAPCPDKSIPVGRLDFKTHPWYSNFCGLKRALSQEPAPAYLDMTVEDIEGAPKGSKDNSAIYDLVRMSPDKLVSFVEYVAETNPDIANQLSRAMASKGRISQAPPGM